jgi:site-specific DNA recombinase
MSKKSNLMLKKQHAAIYARVSSSKQHEEGTIESQINVLAEYAQKNGFDIPEGWIFQDNGVSGSIIQRPALDNLRDLVASGSPDVVLIYHPDRLARKFAYQAVLLEEFSRSGVEVIFYNNKRAETPEEHLLEQFQGVFAEYERAQITERCRRGRLYKARQGSVTVVPNAPYGYKYVRDKEKGLAYYELHKEESETVLKLFQMYALEGKNLTELASFMNENGKKPRRSLLGWDRGSIRRILRNRSYIGLAGFYKTEKCEGDSKRIIRAPKGGRIQVSKFARRNCPEADWITIPVPSIVPVELYNTVQEKLNNSKQFSLRNTRSPTILQGVLVCGTCESSYYKKSRQNAHTYYCCHTTLVKSKKSCDNRSIRQKELDEYVWNWIISILRNPELVETEIKRRSLEDPDGKRITERKMKLQRQQNKLMNIRNKLLDAYTEADCLSLEELKKRMLILNQQTQQVERELAVIEGQTADIDRIKQSLLTLEKFAESLDNSITELSIEEKQRVVRVLIDEIVIYGDSIKIKHCIPMGSNLKNSSKKCLLQTQRTVVASRLKTISLSKMSKLKRHFAN